MKLVMALAALALVAAPALAYQTVSAPLIGTFYLADDATLWEETNSFDGLQTTIFCDEGFELDGSECVKVVDDVETRVPAHPADEQRA